MAPATGVSAAQVAAQLETIVARDTSASARAVAVRSAARQPWPERISARGRPFEVRWCDSLLGLREALLGLEPQGASGGGPDEAGVVLLTPFATHELPDDVAARLFKSRVWQPEGWEIVREMLGSWDMMKRRLREGVEFFRFLRSHEA